MTGRQRKGRLLLNTAPERIGVIGAMQTEIDDLRAQMTDVTVQTVAGTDFVCGKWEGRRLVAAVSGVGKVFSAMCTQAMILTFSPDLILNVGVSGSLSPTLGIGDIAVADSVVQHDMDTTAIGDPPGMLSGINRVDLPCTARYVRLLEKAADSLGLHRETGVIASGDLFVHSAAQKNRIKDQFGAISCEMEGGSIGTVCFVNGVDFCVLRAISDGGNEDAPEDFASSLRKASLAAQNVLYAFLRELPV